MTNLPKFPAETRGGIGIAKASGTLLIDYAKQALATIIDPANTYLLVQMPDGSYARISINDALPQLNVLDYGLIGDGITDESAALQTLVSSLSDDYPHGAIIFFPPGHYKLATGILINSSNIRFQGASATASVIFPALTIDYDNDSANMVFRTIASGSLQRIRFHDLGFDGALMNVPVWLQNPDTGAAIANPAADYTNINIIKDPRNAGTLLFIDPTDIANDTIPPGTHNAVFSPADKAAIAADVALGRQTVIQAKRRNPNVVGFDLAIMRLNQCNNAAVIGCRFVNWLGTCVMCQGAVDGITVTDNYFSGCGHPNFALIIIEISEALGRVYNAKINNNTFEDALRGQIILYATGGEIIGNTVTRAREGGIAFGFNMDRSGDPLDDADAIEGIVAYNTMTDIVVGDLDGNAFWAEPVIPNGSRKLNCHHNTVTRCAQTPFSVGAWHDMVFDYNTIVDGNTGLNYEGNRSLPYNVFSEAFQNNNTAIAGTTTAADQLYVFHFLSYQAVVQHNVTISNNTVTQATVSYPGYFARFFRAGPTITDTSEDIVIADNNMLAAPGIELLAPIPTGWDPASITTSGNLVLPSPVPAWALPGMFVDFDFVAARYFVHPSVDILTTFVNVVRATPVSAAAFAVNAAGIWTGFAANAPRLTDLGLLVERTRTNVVLWNRDLTNAVWTKTNITVALNQTGIDGVANAASAITATAAGGTITQPITLAASQRYQSVFVKRLVGTGTLEMSQNGGASYTDITPAGAAWLRKTIATASLANPQIRFRIGTNGDAFAIDMVQNENGAFPTSPIAVTSAVVTRAADDVTIKNFNLIYLQIGGTLYAEYAVNFMDSAAFSVPFCISDGTLNNRAQVYVATSADNIGTGFVGRGGVTQFSAHAGLAYANGDIAKLALGFSTNLGRVAAHADISGVDVSLALPATITQGQIGGILNSDVMANTYIRRIGFATNRQSSDDLLALVS